MYFSNEYCPIIDVIKFAYKRENKKFEDFYCLYKYNSNGNKKNYILTKKIQWKGLKDVCLFFCYIKRKMT